MSELTRLSVTLPAEHSEDDAGLLQALLALHVAHGWEEESLPGGEMRCLVHFTSPEHGAALESALAEALPQALTVRGSVLAKDWQEAWKEYFTPVECGRRFLVLAPWMKDPQAAESSRPDGRLTVIIEPKTAFGTGHHSSTALCLEALSDLADEGTVHAGQRFLDLGTGSGILGIACAKLGLYGDGLDIDQAAVDNARDNLWLNGFGDMDFKVGLGGVEAARGPYNLILVNILAGPLMEMAGRIVALLAKRDFTLDPPRGPALILSGILDIQADAVERAYSVYLPRAKVRRLVKGEWAALIF